MQTRSDEDEVQEKIHSQDGRTGHIVEEVSHNQTCSCCGIKLYCRVILCVEQTVGPALKFQLLKQMKSFKR